MKKALLIIVCILGLVVIILAGLYQAASLPNKNKNGFNRNWKPEMVQLIRETKVTQPLQKICGATASHYFFSVPNPQGVIVLDTALLKLDTMVYGLPLYPNIFSANSTWIDSPNVYFFANNVPAMYRGRLNNPYMDSISLGKNPFTRAAWVSPDHVVLRTLTKNADAQIFQLINSHTGQVEKEADIIPGQQAGGFENDGTMVYDQQGKRLLYVQYYTNRFYCIDTNLQVLYTGKTIDTTNINPTVIEKTRYKDGDKIAPGSSRITVNETSCTGDGYLFVQSGLRADNELWSAFKQNGVIDVYSVADGKYTGSFYIPLKEGEKITSIFVKDKKLLVLYTGYVAQYRLQL